MPLQLIDVSHRYSNGAGVQNVSFAVGEGEIVCLLGPNGSGKSTTIRLLTGLLRGTGDILVDGSPVHQLPLAEHLGGVIDGGGLDPTWTVAEYLRLVAIARRMTRAAIRGVLISLGLLDLATRRIRSLSLGQTQRVALAGALLGGQRNLVLDEPLNGIDAHTVPLVLERIRRFADSGGSVLVTSHQLTHLETLVDRVVMLRQGELVTDAALSVVLQGSSLRVVRVSCDEPHLLRDALREDDITEVTLDAAGRLIIRGASCRSVAESAHRRGLLVVGLDDVVPTLEEVYLSMTANLPATPELNRA